MHRVRSQFVPSCRLHKRLCFHIRITMDASTDEADAVLSSSPQKRQRVLKAQESHISSVSDDPYCEPVSDEMLQAQLQSLIKCKEEAKAEAEEEEVEKEWKDLLNGIEVKEEPEMEFPHIPNGQPYTQESS